MEYFGNKESMKLEKNAFLCSQRCPADVVLKSYDWAKAQREADNCIVCGNHSQIEKDVFDILLNGKQALILVLARGMKTRWSHKILTAIRKNRLVIISPFDKNTKLVTHDTAEKRNRVIIEISERIKIGYKTTNGQLNRYRAF